MNSFGKLLIVVVVVMLGGDLLGVDGDLTEDECNLVRAKPKDVPFRYCQRMPEHVMLCLCGGSWLDKLRMMIKKDQGGQWKKRWTLRREGGIDSLSRQRRTGNPYYHCCDNMCTHEYIEMAC